MRPLLVTWRAGSHKVDVFMLIVVLEQSDVQIALQNYANLEWCRVRSRIGSAHGCRQEITFGVK